MKNRRFAIVAFLLVATLVMGIGFAAVSGQLNITGSATYNSFAETSSNIHSAIKFTEATAVQNCTASITDEQNGANSADLTVTFNDETSSNEGDNFEAVAIYTIAYESNDTTLSDVAFLTADELNGTGNTYISCDNDNFTVTCEWVDNKNTVSPHATNDHAESIAKLKVTVRYNHPTDETTEEDVEIAIISIKLPYASVAGGSAT